MSAQRSSDHECSSGARPVLERVGALADVERGLSPVVVLTAPSGYGKSTVARQALRRASRGIWVDCANVESEDTLWAAVRDACCGTQADGSRSSLLPLPERGAVAADVTAELAAGLTSPVTLALDALDDQAVLSDAAGFLRSLVDALPDGSRMILTTRVTDPPLNDLGARAIGVETLSVNPREGLDLAARIAPEVSEETVAGIRDEACGQIALIVTMLQWVVHAPAGSASELTDHSDLSFLLRGMAESQLGSSQRLVLCAAAIMRVGWVSDLLKAVPGASHEDVARVASCIPLLSVEHAEGVPVGFRMHDLAATVFDMHGGCDGAEATTARRCMEILESAGRLDVLLRGHLRAGDATGICDVLEAHGEELLVGGHTRLLEAAVNALEPSSFLSRPRLLLLRARMAMDAGRPGEAIRQATIALDLAEHDGDGGLRSDALSNLARAQMDSGLLTDAKGSIRRLLLLEGSSLEPGTRGVAHALLATCEGGTGDLGAALENLEEATLLAASNSLRVEEQVRIATSSGGIEAAMLGQWGNPLELTADLLGRESLPVSLELNMLNNHAVALYERGRTDAALDLILRAESTAEQYNIGFILPVIYSTAGAVHAAAGDYSEAARAFSRFSECNVGALDAATSFAESAGWLRLVLGPERSLACAERALAECRDLRQIEWMSVLEIGASLLALGDVSAAQKRAASVRSEALAIGASHHALRADLTLAEIDRREGRVDAAVSRIHEHRDYILTENANWLVALYTRSFPALLGIVASAVGPDDMPAHLIRLVLPQDREEALTASREVLEPEMWERLAARMLSEEDIERLRPGADSHLCQVRLFGGMAVKVGERTVVERDWRKRKARILFAMLALKQGRDVPRDQILEHLWPDMDEERARNNLYVIWSAVKSALSPEADKGTPCPYVESARGVCKSVSDLVRTDVDELEELVARGIAQEEAGNVAAALEAYDRVYELYRGDLLPGDIYDDWFAAARDHYRHEFSDAMHRAAELSLAEEDASRANRFARRALEHDAWREDLYQVALKSQIATGQRSAAVDTFFTCKGKLSEDLGLDPSMETTRLYEQVLAMEGDAEGPRAYQT